MTIYLIRHGETDWNVQGRLQGIEDIELNENGVRQAQICGEALRGVAVSKIITSPLKRAKRTAEIIASYLGGPEVIEDADFLERDFGRFSGLTPQEIQKAEITERNSEIESFEHLTGRAMNALFRYSGGAVGSKIIIVSHFAHRLARGKFFRLLPRSARQKFSPARHKAPAATWTFPQRAQDPAGPRPAFLRAANR